MHSLEVRNKAVTMVRSGASNAHVARTLQVPAGTVSYWVHLDRARHGDLPGRRTAECPRHGSRPLNTAAYTYVLGQYLGDGHIIQYSGHRVPSLMITCCNAWPGVMDECHQAMASVFPDNSVCRVKKTGCKNVKVYSQHLWCLFPQHGPGRKHERRIALEPWQQDIVDAHPWALIRGLIHSDGCRITNWTTRMVAGRRKRYEYPRYFFTNKSDDIRRILTDTLDAVGVEWTTLARGGDPFNVSVARRASVALMDEHVGPKC
jgi:hypothetical protein